jgi:hypothetical protein
MSSRKLDGIQHPETCGREVPAGANTRQTGRFLHQFAIVLDGSRHVESGAAAIGPASEIGLNT